MQRLIAIPFLVLALLVMGCTIEPADVAEGDGGVDPNMGAPNPEDMLPRVTPVPIEDGVVSLAPQNTSIGFVGTKTDGRHVGGFAEFSGKIELDDDGKTPKSVSVEIQTDSIWSDTGRLTSHLKNADFFHVAEHPTATFQSTSIEATDAEAGEYTIKGDLTLLDATKSISFPAAVEIADEGLTLASKFTIDRTEFGMTYGEGQINHDVAMNVVVGAKSGTPDNSIPGGTNAGGGGGFGGRRFDPEERFKQRDTNSDGKLTADEIEQIPEQFRERMLSADTDGDGAITLEEYKAFVEQFRGGGPGGGRGGPGGPDRPDAA